MVTKWYVEKNVLSETVTSPEFYYELSCTLRVCACVSACLSFCHSGHQCHRNGKKSQTEAQTENKVNRMREKESSR